MKKPTSPLSKPVLLAGGNPQIAKADGVDHFLEPHALAR